MQEICIASLLAVPAVFAVVQLRFFG